MDLGEYTRALDRYIFHYNKYLSAIRALLTPDLNLFSISISSINQSLWDRSDNANEVLESAFFYLDTNHRKLYYKFGRSKLDAIYSDIIKFKVDYFLYTNKAIEANEFEEIWNSAEKLPKYKPTLHITSIDFFISYLIENFEKFYYKFIEQTTDEIISDKITENKGYTLIDKIIRDKISDTIKVIFDFSNYLVKSIFQDIEGKIDEKDYYDFLRNQFENSAYYRINETYKIKFFDSFLDSLYEFDPKQSLKLLLFQNYQNDKEFDFNDDTFFNSMSYFLAYKILLINHFDFSEDDIFSYKNYQKTPFPFKYFSDCTEKDDFNEVVLLWNSRFKRFVVLLENIEENHNKKKLLNEAIDGFDKIKPKLHTTNFIEYFDELQVKLVNFKTQLQGSQVIKQESTLDVSQNSNTKTNTIKLANYFPIGNNHLENGKTNEEINSIKAGSPISSKNIKTVVLYKSFEYVSLNGGYGPINDLYRSLIDLNLISKDTDIRDFRKIFSGNKINKKIIWTGYPTQLSFFIKELHHVQKKVKDLKQKQWEVTILCFELESGINLTNDILRGAKKPANKNDIITLVNSL